MVLLRVVGDQIIDGTHIFQLGQKSFGHGRIHGIQNSGLLAALNEISVVAGSIRKWDQRIEQPPVPIHTTQSGNVLGYVSRFH